ncbi:hemicentin-1-like [Melitaea cinxia]|uniref:hemicentin-1-like n=1 Tax=Melitaea cinxia TaxID=113334 RepID=UPI001E2744F5|nr:hemicentin-1-like [Melitaea cinxia]
MERDVQLETVDLTDVDDNIIQVLTLTLVNEEQQFYVTESFKPPSGMFKIAINGLTKTKEKIRRVSTSTTQYQNPKIEPVPPCTPPTVTLTPESPVYVEPDGLLTLKCLVHGYPEPDVKWADESGKILTPQPMYTVHLRRLYTSVLEIKKPSKNMTVSCTAINEKGDKDSKSIDVKIKNKIYLNVLEYPKDKNVEYNENAEFKCKVDSWPAATITWLRNKKIISSDENFIISPDNSTLTIKEVNTHLKGEYSVNVSNTYETKVFSFQVKIPNLKAPKIDKENSIYARTVGDNVNMTCRVIQGKPKPSMTWSFNKDGSDVYEDLKNAQYFYYISKINQDHSGIFRCEASNEIDKDFHEMQLVVKRPPSVKVGDKSVPFKKGETVRLDCIVDGSPKPSVHWRFNGVQIEVSSRYKIYKNNSLSFIGRISDNGNYHCVAINSEGETDEKIRVIIYRKDEQYVFNKSI